MFPLSTCARSADAVERLLAQALLRDDAVALEDPCFLASIHLAQLGGYRAVPVAVDAEGMTVEGLRHALDQGVRAVVCTPRAQNPTGSSLSPARAAALREVLADHPYVLVIQDDYFSYLSQQPFHSIVGPDHRRWALVRSVSKFVGPDMCLVVTACDADTAAQHALVADGHAARNAAVAGDHRVHADPHIVGDLHQIVDFRALPDHRVAQRAPVDRRVCADLDIVLYDDTAELRHLAQAVGARHIAEPVLADRRARQYLHPVAKQGVLQARARTDVAVAADAAPARNDRIGADDRARTDLHIVTDDGTRRQDHAVLEARCGRNGRAR